MLVVETEVKQSEIAGLGVFTKVDIKKGQLIWEDNKIIDVIIHKEEFAGLPSIAKRFILNHTYKETHNGNSYFILPSDNDKYTNHSTDPNETCNGPYQVVAARDIKAGEELTINYFEFDEDAEYKLKDGFTN